MEKVGAETAYVSSIHILLQRIPNEYLGMELNLIEPTYQKCLHQSYCESISDGDLRTEK